MTTHARCHFRCARHSARFSSAAASLIVGAVLAWRRHAATSRAQWSTAYEQFYLPGKFNWTFRDKYPAADRLFAAFDYGHAILYERLYNDPHAPTSELEEKEYDFITKKLLVSPPRLPLEEAAIEVTYAKIAPEAKMMFDWAHLLHRQIYDVLASENMSQAEKDAKIAELVAYYKTRPDLAFSSVPKNMELMEGPALFARLPPDVSEVQRLDLGLPLAPGGSVRAVDDGQDPGGTAGRRRRGGLALPPDARECARAHAARHADDGRHRADVREAISGSGDHLRQPPRDARRGVGHPDERQGAAQSEARGDPRGGEPIPRCVLVHHAGC